MCTIQGTLWPVGGLGYEDGALGHGVRRRLSAATRTVDPVPLLHHVRFLHKHGHLVSVETILYSHQLSIL
jgi:hypothetical protein